jgi:DNA-binding HxlR family transcriptional regulator
VKEPVPAICARFHEAVELIGSRWTGAVIQALLRGPTRYATIRAAIPDISDRMLSDRLRILELEGLVERHVVPETPVRVEYQLTEKGSSLERALGALGEWAERWIDLPGSPAPYKGVPLPPSSAAKPADPHPILHKPRIKPRVTP